jgi:hypothetical protein
MAMRKMRNIALLLSFLLLFTQCQRKGTQIEKISEDGVEVVVNHREPYSLPGVPAALTFKEVLSIDTEKDDVLNTGMSTMESFCLDRDGNIYFMMRQSPGNFIYKFDASGNFQISFGRKGQGPGEFEWGGDILVDEGNRVLAKDMTKEKFVVFNKDGVLIDEIKIGKNISFVKSLGNKTFLTQWQERDPAKPVYRNHYCISNDTLSENRDFFHHEFDDASRSLRYRPRGGSVSLGASDGNIFIGDAAQGYEILVFDLSGKLLRKIRKAYVPVAFPEEDKATLKKALSRSSSGQALLQKADFPAYLPPFRYLFTDDQGRLYVMTNEREGERNYRYDIFSNEGAFIGRFPFDNVKMNYLQGQKWFDEPIDVIVKGDRLYSLREKDSGFKVLAVYKMTWN